VISVKYSVYVTHSLASLGAASKTFWCPLLFDVAISVDTAALIKAVTHHALTKKENGDCQGD
jgi:hypothetical protein